MGAIVAAPVFTIGGAAPLASSWAVERASFRLRAVRRRSSSSADDEKKQHPPFHVNPALLVLTVATFDVETSSTGLCDSTPPPKLNGQPETPESNVARRRLRGRARGPRGSGRGPPDQAHRRDHGCVGVCIATWSCVLGKAAAPNGRRARASARRSAAFGAQSLAPPQTKTKTSHTAMEAEAKPFIEHLGLTQDDPQL